jgi:hypothetical protein
MIFEISEIADPGNLEKERVILKAKSDGDIGRFAILAGVPRPKGLIASGSIQHAYWFLDQQIKAEDFAVLYTKSGKRSQKTTAGGSTSHFYYWDLKSPIWNTYRAALVNTATWQYSKTPSDSTA